MDMAQSDAAPADGGRAYRVEGFELFWGIISYRTSLSLQPYGRKYTDLAILPNPAVRCCQPLPTSQ